MAYNGTGGWNRLYNWQNDAQNNIKIRADRMDNETNDMCNNGLGAVVTRDGQGSAAADQPMNTFKHTNVGNALARNQYAAAGQLQDGGLVYAVAGGTADALTASFTPAIPALVDGMVFRVKAILANATTVPAIAIDANAAKTITKFGGQSLVPGDIRGPGHELELQYSATGTRIELLNPATPAGAERFMATANAQQTLTNGAYTKALFQTVNFDTLGMYASSRFTATVPGYYLFMTVLSANVGGAGQLSVWGGRFYKNGVGFSTPVSIQVTGGASLPMSAMIFLNATDFVEVYANMTGTASAPILDVGGPASNFSGTYLGQ